MLEMAKSLLTTAMGSAISGYQSRKQMKYAAQLERENFDIQRQANREDTEYYWNRYNSPEAQKKAMLDAGINPDGLAGGGTSVQGSLSSPSMQGPSALPVDSSAVADSLAAVSSIEEARMRMQEMKRSHKYNIDAQQYDLRRAEAEARQAEADAVMKEKDAGTYDARRQEEVTRAADAHHRHLRDVQEMDDNNARELRKIILAERAQSQHEREYNENEEQREATLELTRGQKDTSTAQAENTRAQTRKMDTDQNYLYDNGYYPGSGQSLMQAVGDFFGEDPATGSRGSLSRRILNWRNRNRLAQAELEALYKMGKSNIGYNPKTGKYYVR